MKSPAPASSPQEAMRVTDQTGRVAVFVQRVVLDTEIQMENPSRCRFRGGPNGPVPRCAGALQRVASICNAATPSAKSRDFGLKVPSMSVDLMLPAAEKITLVLEGIGDDKIRSIRRVWTILL